MRVFHLPGGRGLFPPGHRPVLWATACTILAIELLAFYLLCTHQVRRAEVRQQLAQVQLRAFSNCLAYVHGSTIASCSLHMRVRR